MPDDPTPAGIDPCDLATGDFDLDGHADMIVPNSDPSVPAGEEYLVTVLRGDGAGRFRAESYPAGGATPVHIAVGDANGDGLPGALVAMTTTDAAFLEWSAESPRRLRPLEGFAPGLSGLRVQAADLDGDGRDEAVLADDRRVLWFATSSFQPGPEGSLDVAGVPTDLRLADLDRDGTLDLVVGRGFDPPWVVRGDSNRGGFSGAPDAPAPRQEAALPSGGSVAVVRTADVDGDGNLDVLGAGNGRVFVWFGNGRGGLATPTEVTLEDDLVTFGGLELADLDRDGRGDLIYTDVNRDRLVVLPGLGDGRFREGISFPTGSRPISLVVADFDEDGVPDVAVANQYANTVSVYRSRP